MPAFFLFCVFLLVLSFSTTSVFSLEWNQLGGNAHGDSWVDFKPATTTPPWHHEFGDMSIPLTPNVVLDAKRGLVWVQVSLNVTFPPFYPEDFHSNRLVAFDADAGTIVSSVESYPKGRISSGVFLESSEGTIVTVEPRKHHEGAVGDPSDLQFSSVVVGYVLAEHEDGRTIKRVWEMDAANYIKMPSPGSIVSAAIVDSSSPLVVVQMVANYDLLQPAQENALYVMGLDVEKGSLRWSWPSEPVRQETLSMLLVDGSIYVISNWTHAVRLDATTGRVVASSMPFPREYPWPQAVLKMVAAPKGSGYLYALFPGRYSCLCAMRLDTLEMAWNVTIDQQEYTLCGAPMVSPDESRVFVPCQHALKDKSFRLHTVDSKTGAILHTLELADALKHPIAMGYDQMTAGWLGSKKPGEGRVLVTGKHSLFVVSADGKTLEKIVPIDQGESQIAGFACDAQGSVYFCKSGWNFPYRLTCGKVRALSPGEKDNNL